MPVRRPPTKDEIEREKKLCWRNPARFNRMVLGRPAYYEKQAEIVNSVRDYPVTLVQSCNMSGKSFSAAGTALEFVSNHRDAMALITAPTQTQLESVVWRELEKSWKNAWIPLGGRMKRQPLELTLPDGNYILGYSTTSTERLSGHHKTNLLVVIDEASGIEPEIWEAVASLDPSRLLAIGNPLRPSGEFYERCTRARIRKEEGDPDPRVNWIKISAFDTPDIDLERSPRGLANRGWLEQNRNDYGESSLWWPPHVLGEFPESGEGQLIPRDWLDRCVDAPHVPKGPLRMAIDLGGGSDGDRSVILVRDDNGILEMQADRNWTFEAVATRAKLLVQKWGIEPSRLAFDKSAIGHDFINRLQSVGIKDARAYIGGARGNARFSNLRTAAAWSMRQRFDPKRLGPDGATLPAFSIPGRYMKHLRRELQAITYFITAKDKVELTPKAEIAKGLGGSPDLADSMIISWCFP